MDSPKLEAALAEILEETRGGRADVALLRQEFSHHAADDQRAFGELKSATERQGAALDELKLWRAGLVGAKAGASPFVETLLKLLVPLLLAAVIGLGGAYFSGR